MLNQARFALVAVVVLALGVGLVEKTGEYLVVDQPIHTDVIVVLAGDRNDRRFFRGLELLRQGYATHMLVDANSDMILYGRTPAALEDEFIRSLNLNLHQVRVCPTQGDSTDEEAQYVAQCLHTNQIRSVLLVTSDFHTRRALSIFKEVCRRTAGRSQPLAMTLFSTKNGGNAVSGPRPLFSSGRS